MLFLSPDEAECWRGAVRAIMADAASPDAFDLGPIRPGLEAAFRFYAGTRLAAQGQGALGKQWIAAGMLEESHGVFMNAFASSFMDRHGDRLIMPATAFEDPRPFIHFTTAPVIADSRAAFLAQCTQSLPRFDAPLRIMDIGCGNGALLASLLTQLREAGKADEVEEALLIDPSPAMLDMARDAVGQAIGADRVAVMNERIEAASGRIAERYDVALSSLAYHHMPWEHKVRHLYDLAPWIDHFLLFEVDANHDEPELYAPELALSVYQCYGGIIDLVFAHDAPLDLAVACVDQFLMTEAVSLLTQPRGERTEYHMLEPQWRALFEEAFAGAFTCRCGAACYANAHIGLFTLHYARCR